MGNIKLIVKEVFPGLYGVIKRAYRLTPAYKINKKSRERRSEEIQKTNALIMSRCFNDEYKVFNGPFKGMRYIHDSTGSTFLPKIMGSYEEPLHDWLGIIAKNKYNRILDIGCAEGYYAVGFALECPETEVVAYDVNKGALSLANELVLLNSVNNVKFKECCNHEELNNQCDHKTLVFCDIEGAEKELLDLDKVPNLSLADVLVEAHDCFVAGITDLLIARFSNTHKIELVVDYSSRLKKYHIPNEYSKYEYESIIDERRPKNMKFLFMRAFENAM